jgi:hypothetical protein
MTHSKTHVYILTAVAIAGSLLYFYLDPSYNKLFPPCPFYSITGLFCPGCGSQRAFHDLLHGNIAASAGHNLLFVAALPVVGYSAIAVVNNVFRKRKMHQPLFYSQRFTIGVLVVVLLFAILRNVPFGMFEWMRP